MAERITVTEREPDPGQQWKCGDEFLPFHPQASHVPAEYRDGWNRCYWMAVGRDVSAPLTCWGLRFMCADLGPKCRAAGECLLTPDHARQQIAKKDCEG